MTNNNDYARMDDYGCLARVEDGVVFTCPLSADGVPTFDWSEVTDPVPGFLAAVDWALGTNVVQRCKARMCGNPVEHGADDMDYCPAHQRGAS